MSGVVSLVVLIAIFYFFPALAIMSLVIGFLLAPVVIVVYIAYRFTSPWVGRKLTEYSKRREMRKRIKAMLKKNLRYIP